MKIRGQKRFLFVDPPAGGLILSSHTYICVNLSTHRRICENLCNLWTFFFLFVEPKNLADRKQIFFYPSASGRTCPPTGGFVEHKNIPSFTLKRPAFVHKRPANNKNSPAMLNNRQQWPTNNQRTR